MITNRLRLLIIGGDSFIARSFIRYHPGDIEIICISREKTDFHNERILRDLNKIPNSSFLNIDIVFNCIGIAHRTDKVSNELYNEVNYQLAVSFAEKAKKAGVKKFIQMSTISVYGRKSRIDYTTKENPVNDYGLSKFLADQALQKLNSTNFRVIILRPPMIYGPSAPGNMIRLIELVKSKIPLPFSGIRNKRDFLHIGNLIDVVDHIIKTPYSGIMLLTDKNPVSTTELVKIIYKHLKIKPRLFKLPLFIIRVVRMVKPGTVEKLFDSLEINMEKSLKYIPDIYPRYKLEEGIKDMIELQFKPEK